MAVGPPPCAGLAMVSATAAAGVRSRRVGTLPCCPLPLWGLFFDERLAARVFGAGFFRSLLAMVPVTLQFPAIVVQFVLGVLGSPLAVLQGPVA